MIEDPNPTPMPGTYLATNRSGEACVQASGEVGGEAALRQQIEDLLDEFSGVTETRIVADEIVDRLLYRHLAELDRLRERVKWLRSAAHGSGERATAEFERAENTFAELTEAHEQRAALWEVAKGLARNLHAAKAALDDDSLLRRAEQTAERLRAENEGLRARAELAEGERDKANRQLESLARRLHLRFQNEQRLEAEVARLSSGDTPTPSVRQVAPSLGVGEADAVTCQGCGWETHQRDRCPACLRGAPAPQPQGTHRFPLEWHDDIQRVLAYVLTGATTWDGIARLLAEQYPDEPAPSPADEPTTEETDRA